MKNPLISIIIPMHNSEKFITECLDSVIGQTYKNLEIVVVDDDSTDRSADIVAKFVKKHEKLVYMKVENRNAAKTRRDGLKRAKADLVCFVDADDIVDKRYVEHLYKAMKTTQTSISACNIEVFYNEFQFVAGSKQRGVSTIDSNAGSFADHYHITDTNKLTLQTLPCKLFKKDLFNNIDYTVLKTNIFEDNFIMAQILAKVKKIGVIDETLYGYRQSSGTTSESTLLTKVKYNGAELNFVEFFKEVVMGYCRKVLAGPDSDASIDRLCAAEFFSYARMVPDLTVRKEYLEERLKLEQERLKDREFQIEERDAQIRALLDSKSYRLGRVVVNPVSKIVNILKNGK